MTLSHCRICAAKLGEPVYAAPAPALTSMLRLIDVRTEVHVCEECGHGQSPDFEDLEAFYKSDYKISLSSDDHDQLITIADGSTVYRTDFQCDAVLALSPLEKGAKVLDYGCAKATTLKKIVARRTDLRPHVFDVSDDYRPHWSSWVDAEATATFDLPDAWQGRFDLVTAHFVLEHVADPGAVLEKLRSLLAPDGRLFLSVPDAIANPGDVLVVDHINHFTASSLREALLRAKLELVQLDNSAFPGALIAVCGRGQEQAVPTEASAGPIELRESARAWSNMAEHVRHSASANAGRPAAVYGAGFYGSYIRSLLADNQDLVWFLDQNVHMHGTVHMGLPVLAPKDLPDRVEIVYAGLNPLKAKKIIASVPALASRKIVWLA